MIDAAVLTREIETLRNTLDIDQHALLATTEPTDQRALRVSVERCTLELQRLLYQLITLPLETIEIPPRFVPNVQHALLPVD